MTPTDPARAPRPRRSCLTVPGSSERMLAKAATLPCDQVVLDLEDAVAPTAKEAARAQVVAALAALAADRGPRTRSVRINPPASPWLLRDLTALVAGAGRHLDTVVVPKAAAPADVHLVDGVLTQLEREHDLTAGSIGLELQVEDAAGVLDLRELLAASPRVEAVVLGPGDLAAALRLPTFPVGGQPDGLGTDIWYGVRTAMVLAARARGIQAIDGPYASVHDLDGFARAAVRGRAMGFDGTWVLHPGQIEVANRSYGVDLDAFERASDLIDAYASATDGDARGAVLFGAEMIDEATRKLAATTVVQGLAQGLQVRPTPAEVDAADRAAWRAANLEPR